MGCEVNTDFFMNVARLIAPTPAVIAKQTYVIPVLTIRQACLLQSVMPGVAQGDADDLVLFDVVLLEWLPEAVVDALADYDIDTTLSFVADCMTMPSGADVSTPTSAAAERTGHAAHTPFLMILSDVAQVNHCDLNVMINTMSWPLFVVLAQQLNAAAARELMRWAEVELLPHMGKGAKRTLNDMRRRATGQVAVADNEPSAEEIEANRARLRAAYSPAEAQG